MNYGNPHFGLGDLEIVKEISRKQGQCEPTPIAQNVKRMVSFVVGIAQRRPQPLTPVDAVVVPCKEVRTAKQTGTHRHFTIG
jgi:hypothetical protein